MFKSTVFGTYKTISYQWDFGDGTCKLDSDYKECFEANPTHNYFDGKKSFNGAMFTDRRSVTPKVMIRANFGNGTSESWEASAGTITFNNDPRLVLLDLKADNNAGIIPFTVNLMIDPLTLKVVNATPIKYELDWADGTVDTGIVHSDATSLQALSFTHTYTTANAYIPTLKIYIAESNKIFEFKVGELEASARGEGGDIISTIQDGLVIEKFQGENISLENEVLMIAQNNLIKPFKWKVFDNKDEYLNQAEFNTELLKNNISISKHTRPLSYKLSLYNDPSNPNISDKDIFIKVKDITPPILENVELTSGNTVPINSDFSFKIEGFDNASLMSLNWKLINQDTKEVVFNGYKNISGSEIKEIINFTISDGINEGNYSLNIELIDESGNITSSSEYDFDLEIALINKEYYIKEFIPGYVSAEGFALGAGSLGPVGLAIAIATTVGLKNLSKYNDTPYEKFKKDFEKELQDASKDLPKEIMSNLCKEETSFLNNLSSLGTIDTLEKIANAAKFAYNYSSKSMSFLNNFEYDLTDKKNSKYTTLNTQASNITVYFEDGELKYTTGGDKTKSAELQGKDPFYLPHVVNSIKYNFNQTASLKAHLGLAYLFSSELPSKLFNTNTNQLALNQDLSLKPLSYGYMLVENNFDISPETFNAFVYNELNGKKLSEITPDNKLIIVTYIQRLIQDLGVIGPVNGILNNDQISALKLITPSMSDDLNSVDLLLIKSLASRSRSTFLGLFNRKVIVTENRDTGYDTFIGSLVGALSSGLEEDTSYQEIIGLYKNPNAISQSDLDGKNNYEIAQLYKNSGVNVLDILLEKGISEEALKLVGNNLYNKITRLVSYALPGTRREIIITDLTNIIKKLKDYAISRNYSSKVIQDFEAAEIILSSYIEINNSFVDKKNNKEFKDKEDYLGVLNENFIAKRNMIKKVLKNTGTSLNNDTLANIKTYVSKDTVKNILYSKIIPLELKKKIISYAAIGIGRAYKNALLDIDDLEDRLYKAENEIEQAGGRVGTTLLKINDLEKGYSSDLLKSYIKRLRRLAKLIIVSGNIHLLDIDSDELIERLPTITSKEIKTFFRTQIKTQLIVKNSSTLSKIKTLNISLDKNFAESIVDSKPIKELLKEVLNEFNGKVFESGDSKIIIVNPDSYDWLNLVDDNGEALPDPDIDNENFNLNDNDTGRRNLIQEVSTLNENIKESLVKNQVLQYQDLTIPENFFSSALKGGVCENVMGASTNDSFSELPPESSVSNASFKFTVDTLGAPSSLLLMSSVTFTKAVSEGVTGVYTITNPINGAAYESSFSISEAIAANTIRELPLIEIIGDELADLLIKLGVSTLEGLKVTVKIAKNGLPFLPLAEGILHAEPAGLEEAKIELNTKCFPLTQTITQGESANINYFTSPLLPIVSLNATSSLSNEVKSISPSGLYPIKPSSDASVTFTSSLEEAMSSATCEVKVLPKDKNPGKINVTIDERIVRGYSVTGKQIQRNYPVEYIITNDISMSIIANGNLDFYRLMSETHTVNPNQNYTVTLKVNNTEVDKQSKFVSENTATSYSFTGGVWRKYMGKEGKDLSISTNTIKVTLDGDLGTGAYVSNLAERPYLGLTPGTKRYEICRLLRLFKLFKDDGNMVTLSDGSIFTLDNPRPGQEEQLLGNPVDPKYLNLDRITTYVDYYLGEISTNKLYEKYKSTPATLKYQFVIPSDRVNVLNLNGQINDGKIINEK